MALDFARFRDGFEGPHPSQGLRAWLKRVSRPEWDQRQATGEFGSLQGP